MIFWFSSRTYQSMISKTVTETGLICAGGETGEEIYLLKYVKEHITLFSDIDILIVDLSALADTDEEITAAFESLRIMDYSTRFIVLAAGRREGDSLLKQLFYMGVYDLVATDDYLQIHEELTECILRGKKYRDALRFRDATVQESREKQESRAIQKVLVGITGACPRCGCTHNSIVLANFLRQKGYMVAVTEQNRSGAFEQICSEQQAKMFQEGYFSLRGVDFYPDTDREKLLSVTGKLYNFIIMDFGSYQDADRLLYSKCDVNMVLCGSKPWETGHLSQFFGIEESVLRRYHFCFLFAAGERQWQKDLMESMQPLENVYFPEYTLNPFESSSFPEGNAILKDYLPYVEKPRKKSLFGGRRKN